MHDSSDISIPNTTPSVLVCVPSHLVEEAARIQSTDPPMLPAIRPETFAICQVALTEGDALLGEAARVVKAISDCRRESTRPLDDLKKLAIEAERQACAPLQAMVRTLTDTLGRYRDKLKAAVRSEQQRVQREAMEAMRRQEEENKMADAIGVEPVAVAVPVAPEQVASGGTRKKVTRRVEIDAAAFLRWAMQQQEPGTFGGQWIVQPATKQVERMALAGVQMGGVTVHESEGYARTGR